MTVFDFLTLVGGLALFLYGMNVMSSGLTKISGGKLERSLERLTSNQLRSIALGGGITIAIQSSSALTVMLVGLVNSGIMGLRQTIGVIMGSNIGTTLTPWILSLSGIDSGNTFIGLLKPTSFSPVVAMLGIILIMISKNNRKKELGHVMVGFAVLMFGMSMMGDAMEPLSRDESFTRLLTMFSNPLLGVIAGTLFTGIIQSSAASVGILQALAGTGSITFGSAIPIIMGQNIGTCVTALLSSIGVNKNARRVAIVHISFNVIGTVIFLGVFYLLNAIIKFAFLSDAATAAGIALTHTVFNLVTTIVFLPFTKFLEKLANLLIRDKEGSKEEYELLDSRLLLNPPFAVEHCKLVADQMAQIVRDSLFLTMELIIDYDPQKAKIIEENEDKIDFYEDKIGSYLVKISSNSLSMRDSRKVSMLLQNIGDLERIGDHSLNMLRSIEEINTKRIDFSEPARNELTVAISALQDIVSLAINAFISEDLSAAALIEPLEQVIDSLIFEMKARHTARLREGLCTLETGFIFADITNNIERVSDHCSNIGVCLIEVDGGSFETHEYLRAVKNSKDSFFSMNFDNYRNKYRLPIE